MKETGLERICRDLRIFRIFEGTNDILRLFVALSGIQYAGGHLKELQRAFKNPAANLGLIIKEVGSRAALKVGLSGCDLSSHVDPSLRESSKLCAQVRLISFNKFNIILSRENISIFFQSIDAYGQTVEQLLVKYGKNIIDQQFLLNRLADCAIDIYVMTCVLSRATRSLKIGLESAEHEALMAKAWCIEAAERCRVNNKKLQNPDYLAVYPQFKQIAGNICKAQGVASINPINV